MYISIYLCTHIYIYIHIHTTVDCAALHAVGRAVYNILAADCGIHLHFYDAPHIWVRHSRGAVHAVGYGRRLSWSRSWAAREILCPGFRLQRRVRTRRCVAVCCSVLQCIALYCSVKQSVFSGAYALSEVCCSVVAGCCRVLHCPEFSSSSVRMRSQVCCNVLQSVAMCYSVLQCPLFGGALALGCVAVCRSALPVCRGVLQVGCSVLQCVAVSRISPAEVHMCRV